MVGDVRDKNPPVEFDRVKWICEFRSIRDFFNRPGIENISYSPSGQKAATHFKRSDSGTRIS